MHNLTQYMLPIQYAYSQKESYLIDCKGYSSEDFNWIGEQGIDNIIIDNDDVAECLSYNS